MLEYLTLTLHSNSDRMVIRISYENELVVHRVEILPDGGNITAAAKVSQELSREWMKQLENLHIEQWKPEIKEHNDWEIVYKRVGEKPVESGFSQEYPDEWTPFMELLDEIAPEAKLIDGRRIEHMDLLYRYCREKKLQKLSDRQSGLVAWNYSEHLVIDRKTAKLTYTRNVKPGCVLTSDYYVENGIAIVLAGCREYLDIFDGQNPDKQKERGKREQQKSEQEMRTDRMDLKGRKPVILQKILTEEEPLIDISIGLHNGQILRWRSGYNRKELPDDWEDFLEQIEAFISCCNDTSDIFNCNRYGHGVKKGEYIYCSVEFSQLSGTYYYRTEDDTLQIGDRVIVPVGRQMQEKIARIVDIEYFTKENVPFPLARTKCILQRYEEHPQDVSVAQDENTDFVSEQKSDQNIGQRSVQHSAGADEESVVAGVDADADAAEKSDDGSIAEDLKNGSAAGNRKDAAMYKNRNERTGYPADAFLHGEGDKETEADGNDGFDDNSDDTDADDAYDNNGDDTDEDDVYDDNGDDTDEDDAYDDNGDDTDEDDAYDDEEDGDEDGEDDEDEEDEEDEEDDEDEPDEQEKMGMRIEELLDAFEDCDVDFYTCADPDYDFLSEEGRVLIVHSPDGDSELYIELDEEFTLAFGGWHAHYSGSDEDYIFMLNDIEDIVTESVCVVNVSSGLRALSTMLCSEHITAQYDKRKLITNLVRKKKFIQEMRETGGKIQIVYWNSDHNILFEIMPED